MRIGVIGDSFREDRAFTLRLNPEIDFPFEAGKYPNLAALRQFQDPLDRHYQIKSVKGRFYLEVSASGKKLGQYQRAGSIELTAHS
ncbi:MAG: hypothetical protein HY513_05690 [Candidatus Aenigmarchaeota archaeon]|nr:hypothetical protein [Candidatus Aenigmarchaeota archaeon]